ncbi:MAG: DUF192 domain-containing protein [Alphaproteobacteria bacterium]|nr:DUF192 domain-containing protein [Alphaproteobacteria bacterium]
MKKLIQLLSFIFLLTACNDKDLTPITIQTSNGDVTYYVEVADTLPKMQKGLMNRKKLKTDSGMIFIFSKNHPQPIAMWMKNTYISLDMLFLDSNGKIIALEKNTTPMSERLIRPTLKPTSYVVELNAGEIKKHDIKIGDKVLF